jgi:hypothetical protein
MFPAGAGGQVGTFLRQPVPGGALDDLAHLMFTVDQAPALAAVLIEVKNLRHWIYPSSDEIFQLLDKAAQLQLRHPDQQFVAAEEGQLSPAPGEPTI